MRYQPFFNVRICGGACHDNRGDNRGDNRDNRRAITGGQVIYFFPPGIYLFFFSFFLFRFSLIEDDLYFLPRPRNHAAAPSDACGKPPGPGPIRQVHAAVMLRQQW